MQIDGTLNKLTAVTSSPPNFVSCLDYVVLRAPFRGESSGSNFQLVGERSLLMSLLQIGSKNCENFAWLSNVLWVFQVNKVSQDLHQKPYANKVLTNFTVTWIIITKINWLIVLYVWETFKMFVHGWCFIPYFSAPRIHWWHRGLHQYSGSTSTSSFAGYET